MLADALERSLVVFHLERGAECAARRDAERRGARIEAERGVAEIELGVVVVHDRRRAEAHRVAIDAMARAMSATGYAAKPSVMPLLTIDDLTFGR